MVRLVGKMIKIFLFGLVILVYYNKSAIRNCGRSKAGVFKNQKMNFTFRLGVNFTN